MTSSFPSELKEALVAEPGGVTQDSDEAAGMGVPYARAAPGGDDRAPPSGLKPGWPPCLRPIQYCEKGAAARVPEAGHGIIARGQNLASVCG